MASSLLLRRATSTPLLTKLICPVRIASVSRPINTNAQVANYGDGEDLPPSLPPAILLPGSSKGLNLMEQFMEGPLVKSARGMGAVSRRGWNVNGGRDALFVRMDVPGLGKEDVKVSVEQNTLIIIGQGGKESENDESGRKYTSRIDLSTQVYKLYEIKVEMKNGVLKVWVPRVRR